jgi:hypothetical protein
MLKHSEQKHYLIRKTNVLFPGKKKKGGEAPKVHINCRPTAKFGTVYSVNPKK